jgi:predicted neuraminidase
MSSSPRPFLHFGLLQALLAGALICLRGVLPASALERERIFGPEVKTGDYKHPASFTQLGNGDLYLVFFSGRGEYKDNQAAVFGSRLKSGTRRWSKPVSIASNPFHALGNAVIWEAPDRVVWLFYVTRYGELWSDSRITAKVSRDGAKTWSEPFQITFEAGTLVRNRPVVLEGGDWLLPVYHEVGTDPELDDPRNRSFFLRYHPEHRAWTESNRIGSRLGNIQPAPAVIEGDHLVAFCRRGGNYDGRPDGWMVRTESRDGGRTWSEGVDSALPNPNAAVDFLRLRSGHHLLVYNHSFTNRTPLTAALSFDGAKTFPRRRDLESDPKGDFGYPTAIQTRDGRIHILYTSDERTVVRHLTLSESDLTSGEPRP